MRVLIALVLAITAVAAVPSPQRIVGGSPTTIDNYPEIVALLFSWGTTGHRHSCGGSILNNRSVLTAAHCSGDVPARWQSRVGSTYANSGGIVYATSQIFNHPDFHQVAFFDADVAIIRIAGSFTYSDVVRPGTFPAATYHLADNQVVWAAGWGTTSPGSGILMEQLHHVQVWTVNQDICRTRYTEVNLTITDNMLCSGWLDVGGRDQCQGDSGGPLYHNGVVVGICSFGQGCAEPRYPGVNARVSRFVSWIQSNA